METGIGTGQDVDQETDSDRGQDMDRGQGVDMTVKQTEQTYSHKVLRCK